MLAREPNTVIMSCELDLGVRDVVDRCWEELRLIRVYTKRQVFFLLFSFAATVFCFPYDYKLTTPTERVSIQTLARHLLSVAIRQSKMFVMPSIAVSRKASSMRWYGALLPNTFLKGLVLVTLSPTRMLCQSLVQSLVLQRSSRSNNPKDISYIYVCWRKAIINHRAGEIYILQEPRRKTASCSIFEVGPPEHPKLVVYPVTGRSHRSRGSSRPTRFRPASLRSP